MVLKVIVCVPMLVNEWMNKYICMSVSLFVCLCIIYYIACVNVCDCVWVCNKRLSLCECMMVAYLVLTRAKTVFLRFIIIYFEIICMTNSKSFAECVNDFQTKWKKFFPPSLFIVRKTHQICHSQYISIIKNTWKYMQRLSKK